MEDRGRPRLSTPAFVAIVGCFAVALVTLLLAKLGEWGFHRDEFLYLAQGRRPAWGYWSTPPLVGFVARVLQGLTYPDLVSVRAVPAVVGAASMLLTASIAREMGGGPRAIVFACMPFLLSPAFLRTANLFQPVVFDIFLWTLGAWVVTRYIRREEDKWLLVLGGVLGVAVLNKYSVVFFVIGLTVGALATRHRTVLKRPAFAGAIAIATLIALPNLVWQFQHGLPVMLHARELAETQLVNVSRVDFLAEQVLIHLPVALFWIAGLAWLFSKRGARFRMLGWTFAGVVLLLLVLRGKSYYTLGAFPMVFAAGAVWLERVRWPAVRWALVTLALIVGIGISPISLPYLSVPAMVEYGARFVSATGVDAPLRWETGRVHELPQDYSDMLGWQEMADLAIEAWKRSGGHDRAVIYAENYGEAGAIEHYGGPAGLPPVISFADSYRLWAPDILPRQLSSFIYVNDELGADIDSVFAKTTLIGRVGHPHARERGVGVFLLSEPDSAAWDFYSGVAGRVKASFRDR